VFRSLLIAAVLGLAWAGGAWGAGYEGLIVTDVAFSPPAQPVPTARLEQLMEIRPGAPLDIRAVRRTIEALFVTGRYADIQVDAVRSEGGVRLTFITVQNWFIGQVTVSGVSEPPTPAQLAAATRLELGASYTAEKAEQARDALLRLLAENGLHHAKITWETFANSETQQIDIVFQVQPGSRARFGNVTATGSADLTAAELRELTGWSRDDEFTQPRVQRGLQRLYRHYRDRDYLQASVRFAAQEYVPQANRVNVVLEIEAGPRVEVAISGASLSRRQLRRYVPIYEEGTIDRDLLAEGARNLRDHFQTEGYFDARVDYAENPVENGILLVEFQVTLRERHQLVRLDITGNRFFDEATIRERMYLRTRSLQFRRGRFSQGLLASDLGAIEELYRSNGFLSVKVHTRVEDDFQGNDGDYAVFLEIVEGPQTLIADLRIEGNESIPNETFTERLNSIAGQAFSDVNVAMDRDLILGMYFREGFPDATFEWRATPGPGDDEVVLEYTIQEGRRQFVRQVIANGYERTREAVVRREIVVYPGEPLSQYAVLESQRRLYDLGIFSQVNTAIQNPNGDENYRSVLLQVEEARRWTVGVGGGAEIARFGGSQRDLESPAGQTGFSPRVAFELTRLNLLGRAYTGSLRSQFSTLQTRGVLSFIAPQWRGRERLTLNFSSLYDISRNVRTFSARRLEGALQLEHRISRPTTLFYRYSYRRVAVQQGTLKISPALIPLLSQPVRVGSLSSTWVQDRRDDPLDARRGIYNTVDLGAAAGQLGSEASFLRYLAQNATYHAVSRRVVLARTTQIGALIPFGSLRRVETPQPDGAADVRFTREIPLPERFFSGGASSHRGFSINQAGPRDLTTGFPLGGNALVLNSLELRFPVRGENIGGVIFHDAGNVFARVQDLSFRFRQRNEQDFNYTVHAAGLGIRYRTPIGPIRLDLAYSLNPPRFVGFQGTRDELLAGGGTPTRLRLSHLQFHFSLGQTF
jgi:outer membrane protein insertion porin family